MSKLINILLSLFIVAAIPIAILYYSNPAYTWHLFHLATMPDDLFTPIIIDKYNFNQQNFSKEYKLNPKYRDLYEIVINSKNGFNASDFADPKNRYNLKGKFKIELFKGEKRILQEKVEKWSRASFMDADLKTYKNLSIYEFSVPIEGFKINDIKLRFSVIEPSLILKKYNDLQLKIEVSGNK